MWVKTKARWQILLLVLMYILFVFVAPAHANSLESAQAEIVVTARPNMQEDSSSPNTNSAPLSNAISHVIPIAFAVSGVALAIVLAPTPALAVTVLIITALGTVTLQQLLGALW